MAVTAETRLLKKIVRHRMQRIMHDYPIKVFRNSESIVAHYHLMYLTIVYAERESEEGLWPTKL